LSSGGGGDVEIFRRRGGVSGNERLRVDWRQWEVFRTRNGETHERRRGDGTVDHVGCYPVGDQDRGNGTPDGDGDGSVERGGDKGGERVEHMRRMGEDVR
jgi:hypothetical protein